MLITSYQFFIESFHILAILKKKKKKLINKNSSAKQHLGDMEKNADDFASSLKHNY